MVLTLGPGMLLTLGLGVLTLGLGVLTPGLGVLTLGLGVLALRLGVLLTLGLGVLLSARCAADTRVRLSCAARDSVQTGLTVFMQP